ncbi:LuxR C-terminal-related transcriptional regulator [Egicoccus sp. AB-alg2]|uniref:LuxR C-terminal-related transcriptional regulator n=1 Tax=Egicoccus sp. AB-alg2 TaxID=3242693 RepID=UPI00359CDCCC
MSSSRPTAPTGTDGGWEALRAGDWAAARTLFDAAVAVDGAPEAWEGLGWANYFLDEDPGTFEAREAAYRAYRERGDDASAARVAAWLAADHYEFRGEPAVANGWLRRARRLLEGQPPGPDHGWLAVHEASFILLDDPEAAGRLGAEAAALGRRYDVPELEMVGLATEGLAKVLEGDLADGMHRLDEATVVALGGEADQLACVAWACCYLISACEQVRDYDRAGQWCVRMTEFCERHGVGLMLGQCRAKYARVLIWEGRWEEAETQLGQAETELGLARPALTGEALVRLGDLRQQQGRLEEAAALYARCDGNLYASLGLGSLALTRGDAEQALDLADRFLRRLPPHAFERAGGLELAVHAAVRLGQGERARRSLDELQQLAARVGTGPLQTAALACAGTVAAFDGDHASARRAFEDALDTPAGRRAPFEAARIRVELATTLRALGRRSAALVELERALVGLRDLGAAAECARVEALARQWRAEAGPGEPLRPDGPLGSLTPREREVLCLVAEGLTNHQIAQRLVLSEHTVHRHVGNLLRKLALPSRTAAASLAVQQGLL